MEKKKYKSKKQSNTNKVLKNLLIVESPTKADTISKYLKSNYRVISSMGHIMDLPKSRLGINIDNNFEPDYISVKKASKTIKEIKEAAAKSKKIYLASDNDREGEAIAWGIKQIIYKQLKEKCPEIQRIVFNEITPEAIQKSIENPKDLNQNKINAQKARRVLDRLVGYHLSPLLWTKVKSGLSAGRVQSASLKLLCDRHYEISGFTSQEYWEIDGIFSEKETNKSISLDLQAHLNKYLNKKIDIKTEKEATEIEKNLIQQSYIIKNIKEKETKRKPYAPFITSQLQQEASTRLNFSVDRTMKIAQTLYEGIKLEKEKIGLISYIRTDSLRASAESIKEARSYIKDSLGAIYLPSKEIIYTNKKKVQDAHECIRPTSVWRHPELVKKHLTLDQYKLYKLIWSRFIASQMNSAVYKHLQIDIENEDCKIAFKAVGSYITFLGFLKILEDFKTTDKEANEEVKLSLKNFNTISKLKEGNSLQLKKVTKKQLFTKAPPHYTEASLVKALETSGIGRPSTYSPTIQTLFKRTYTYRDKKKLEVSELGLLINELISEFFPNITNSEFTSNMENFLDQIEEAKLEWNFIIKEFFDDFNQKLIKAESEMKNLKNSFQQKTDISCELCQEKMLIRTSFRKGEFLGCSQFPKCRYTKSITFGKCIKENCSGDLIQKHSKQGKFFGCNQFPKCKFALWNSPIPNSNCSYCNKILFLAYSKTKKTKEAMCMNELCSENKLSAKEKK